MGLNVTFNSNSLTHIMFGMRAFEVLYLENDVEFDGNNYNVVFHKEKFLPLRFVRPV